MRDYFEHAYEGFSNTIVDVAESLQYVGKVFLIMLIYTTVPFWFLPYHIFKKTKENDTNETDKTA